MEIDVETMDMDVETCEPIVGPSRLEDFETKITTVDLVCPFCFHRTGRLFETIVNGDITDERSESVFYCNHCGRTI